MNEAVKEGSKWAMDKAGVNLYDDGYKDGYADCKKEVINKLFNNTENFDADKVAKRIFDNMIQGSKTKEVK